MSFQNYTIPLVILDLSMSFQNYTIFIISTASNQRMVQMVSSFIPLALEVKGLLSSSASYFSSVPILVFFYPLLIPQQYFHLYLQ